MSTMPAILYHGCRKADVPSILESGLDPAYSRSGLQAVYLTDDYTVAEAYSSMDASVSHEPASHWVVLAIDAKQLIDHLFSPDDYELADVLLDMSDEDLEAVGLWPGASWKDCDPELSLELCNQVAYADVTPACAIEVFHPEPVEMAAGPV